MVPAFTASPDYKVLASLVEIRGIGLEYDMAHWGVFFHL